MENQPEKFRILLKPLGDSRHALSRARRLLMMGRVHNPWFQQDVADLAQKLEQETSGMPPRVIDADFVKIIDDGTVLAGIGPTSNRKQYLKGFVGSRKPKGTPALKRKKRDHEFYDLKWVSGYGGRPRYDGDTHGLYELQQKFEKILSINVDNVISINGKPIMNVRELDKGMTNLELEDWSIDNIADLLGE